MICADFAFPVRPGEHACCRSADPRDRERLLAAFVDAGLARDHKVVRLGERAEHDELLAHLCPDDAVDVALARGQLVLRDASGTYGAPDALDVDEMVQALRAEFDEHTLAALTAAHHVVVSPELAAIGRTGVLAAARVTPPDMLRLAGELDFEAADGVAGVLETEFHGRRRIDAADLEFVDIAGMRALRGTKGEPLVISAGSEAVHRLVGLLGWDTDPAVEVVA